MHAVQGSALLRENTHSLINTLIGYLNEKKDEHLGAPTSQPSTKKR
jgi:hypothetical protein